MPDEIVSQPEVPDGVEVMANGGWRDKETGRIVKGPSLTTEQARELASRRKRITGRAQRDALIRAMGMSPVEDEAANDVLYAQAVAEAEQVLWDAFIGKEGTLKHRLDVYKALRDMEGTASPEQAEPTEGMRAVIDIAPEVAREMANTLARARSESSE